MRGPTRRETLMGALAGASVSIAAPVAAQTPASPALRSGVYDARDPAFGIAGNGDGAGGGRDDTTAIRTAIEGLEAGETLVFTRDPRSGRHVYNVTGLRIEGGSNIYSTVRFEKGVYLFGTATTPTSAVVELAGVAKMTWEGLQIRTDGTASPSRFHDNYDCALRLAPLDRDGSLRPCQFLRFVEGQIANFRRGIVIGTPEGQDPSPRLPMSENVFHMFEFYGVEGPLVLNAENAFVEFAQSLFVAQRMGSGDWWSDEDGFLIRRTGGGSVTITGGELQRAIAEGYGLDGQEIYVSPGTVFETAAENRISGNVALPLPSNGYVSPQAHARFRVTPNATGTLHLSGRLEKNTRDRGGRAGLLVDASAAPRFDYVLDIDAVDFLWDARHPLIVGGRPDIRRIAIRDDVDDQPVEFTYAPTLGSSWDWRVATHTGDSMGDGFDARRKGGWTAVGSGPEARFGALGANDGLPADTAHAIRVRLPGTIATPAGTEGHLLTGAERAMEFALRVPDPGDGIALRARFHDAAGTELDRFRDVLVADPELVARCGLDRWQRMCLPLRMPAGARFAQIAITSLSERPAEVHVTSLALR